jgi:hypothetical protein
MCHFAQIRDGEEWRLKCLRSFSARENICTGKIQIA